MGEYDAALLGQLLRRPGEALPAMEAAAADALRTLLCATDRGADAEAERDAMDNDADGAANTGDGADRTPRQLFRGASVQVLLRGSLTPTPLGSIQAHHMNSLLKCPGIIISCARVRPRAVGLRIRCAKCMDSRTVFCDSSVSGTGASAAGPGSSESPQGLRLGEVLRQTASEGQEGGGWGVRCHWHWG